MSKLAILSIFNLNYRHRFINFYFTIKKNNSICPYDFTAITDHIIYNTLMCTSIYCSIRKTRFVFLLCIRCICTNRFDSGRVNCFLCFISISELTGMLLNSDRASDIQNIVIICSVSNIDFYLIMSFNFLPILGSIMVDEIYETICCYRV